VRRALIAALALLLPLAACGGRSADEYRERLDAACGELRQTMDGLPQTVRDQDLTVKDAAALAQRASDRFEDELQDLDPPGDLEDAHEALLEAGNAPAPSSDDRPAMERWSLRFAELYDELGAERCAEGQRRAAEEIAESAG
jgi:hypothetical protein